MKTPKVLRRGPDGKKLPPGVGLERSAHYVRDPDGNVHRWENHSSMANIGGRPLPPGWRECTWDELPPEQQDATPERVPDTRGQPQEKPYRPRAPGRKGVRW